MSDKGFSSLAVRSLKYKVKRFWEQEELLRRQGGFRVMELEDFLKEMLHLRLDTVTTPIWPGIYLKPDELQLTTERRRHTSGSANKCVRGASPAESQCFTQLSDSTLPLSITNWCGHQMVLLGK